MTENMPHEKPVEKELGAKPKGDPNSDKIEERKSESEESVMSLEEAQPPAAPPVDAPATPEEGVPPAPAEGDRIANIEAVQKTLVEQVARIQEILDEVLKEEEVEPTAPASPEPAVKAAPSAPPMATEKKMSNPQPTAMFSKLEAMEKKLNEMSENMAKFTTGSRKGIPSGSSVKKDEISEGESWFREYNQL